MQQNRKDTKTGHSRYEIAHAQAMKYGKEGAIAKLERSCRIAARLQQNCSAMSEYVRREVAHSVQGKALESEKEPSEVQHYERASERSEENRQRSNYRIHAIVRDVVADFEPVITEAVWDHIERLMPRKVSAPRTSGRSYYGREDSPLMQFGKREFDGSKHPRAPAGRSDGGQFVRGHVGASPSAQNNVSQLEDHVTSDELYDFKPLRESKAFPGYLVSRDGMLIDPETGEPVQLAGSQPGAGGIFNGGPGREGHHWVPQSVWDALTESLPEDVRQMFDQYKSDPGLYNHGFDTWTDILTEETHVTHAEYINSTKSMLSLYIQEFKQGFEKKGLSLEQAKGFALMIGEGRIPDGLDRDIDGALKAVLKKSPDAWRKVNTWRTGFWNSVGVGQWLLDHAKTSGVVLPDESQLKLMIREIVGNPSDTFTHLDPVYKKMVDSFKKTWERIKVLPDKEKYLWWSKNVWRGAAKRLGVAIDKLPVVGGALSAGGFILFFSHDSYAGDGPFAKGVGGYGGVALNGGLYAARDLTWADLWEGVAKTAGETIAPFTGVPDLPVTRGGRAGVNLGGIEPGILTESPYSPKRLLKPEK